MLIGSVGFTMWPEAAGVPILVVYVDSAVRTIGIEGLMEPSDDVEADMQQLKTFFDGLRRGLSRGIMPLRVSCQINWNAVI